MTKRTSAPPAPAGGVVTQEDVLLEMELAEKERRSKRRKFLLGTVAIGGSAITAYEIIPRLPHVAGNGSSTTNVEQQVQSAYNSGFTAGSNAALQSLISSLDSIEGFSLEGAIEAAKLTRLAYDVFVTPLASLATTVAEDFLSAILDALITGRQWLAQINEDSPTLEALQSVLQSWVNQASEMPKKIQSVTDTDLDGAQAYLRALLRKIQEEQAKLNAQVTPTPAQSPTPQPSLTPKP